ncbi:MAG: HNH endonuclease domain-containing protein [Bacteroidota bacterium]|nr:HNH endonuclease domain-containing protein [Bacteroidota bacterium]
MAKILGLDLGTNSIGWALIDDVSKQIIKSGVRIFPKGVVEDTSGKETTKNQQRRIARGARRLNYRFKMRRERLKKVLSELNMLPDGKYYTEKKGDKKNLTIELYKLRSDALERQISLQELGRIFLKFNNNRGFKSNKKEEALAEFTETKNEETGIVKTIIGKLQDKIDEAKENGNIKHGTIGEYYYYLIRQNKDSHNPNEPIEKIRGDQHYTLREMFEYEFDCIWEKQKSYPNYLKLLTDENKKKIKDECIFFQRPLRSQKHLVATCSYEFTTYFDKKTQKIKKSYLRCCPKSSFEYQEFRIWTTINNIRYSTEDITLAELTPIQKDLLAKKLHTTKSIFLHELKKGNKEEKAHIKNSLIELKKELGLPLEAEFNEIYELKGNITKVRLLEALGEEFWNNLNPKEISADNEPIKYSQEQYQLWHNTVFASEFIKSKEWLLGKKDVQDWFYKKGKKKGKQIIAKKWNDGIKALGLNDEQLIKYAKINLEPDYTEMSLKAIKKLLPWIKQGYDLRKAEKYAGYHDDSSIKIFDKQLEQKIPQPQNNELRNPIVQKGLSEAIRVINAIIDDEEFGKPDLVRVELARELKKPKTKREEATRNIREKEEARRRYAEFISKKRKIQLDQSHPDILKFELFLELEFSKKNFESIKGNIDLKAFEKFCKDVNPKDTEKYKLWLECDRVLPYTGEQIGLARLFTPEIEIEHIIPYSKCGDNSFLNKTLSDSKFNKEKGNRTPLEHEWNKKHIFFKNIKKLSEGKQKRFLMKVEDLDDFRNSQITDTAYIARQTVEYLRKAFQSNKVQMTNGQSTGLVRQLLGFNTLLNPTVHVDKETENGKYWGVYDEEKRFVELIPYTTDDEEPSDISETHTVIRGSVYDGKFYPRKTRDDHRHHAIDAIVTAVTSLDMIEMISQYTQIEDFDEYAQIKKERKSQIKNRLFDMIDCPNLRDKAKASIENILVSYNNKNRITSSGKKRIYKNGKPENNKNTGLPKYSGGDVARGALHDDTYYGLIKNPANNGEMNYVVRKELKFNKKGYFSKVEQIDNIIDPAIREIVKQSLKDNNDNLQKALEHTLFLPNKNGSPVPIKKVRIKVESIMQPIRSETNKKLFVQTGENSLIALFGSAKLEKKEKRNFETITLFDAANRIKNRKPLFNSSKNGLPLLIVFSKRDMIIVYKEHPDEINWNDDEFLFKRLYRVVKADQNGIIVLARHFPANVKADYDKPVKAIDSIEGSVIRCNHNTFRGVKVKITPTGKIEPLKE